MNTAVAISITIFKVALAMSIEKKERSLFCGDIFVVIFVRSLKSVSYSNFSLLCPKPEVQYQLNHNICFDLFLNSPAATTILLLLPWKYTGQACHVRELMPVVVN